MKNVWCPPYALILRIMKNNLIKSVDSLSDVSQFSCSPSGHLIPQILRVQSAKTTRKTALNRSFLDGNLVRRKHPLRSTDYCIWDTELPGFGLRIRSTGRYYWFVRVRHRNKQRRISLGCSQEVDAATARKAAKQHLAAVALDGLPGPVFNKAGPTLNEFVAENWTDIARLWKLSTARRNLHCWERDLAPRFGTLCISEVVLADVMRWRDDSLGGGEAGFNRAVPVLSALFKYAEALKLRSKGSNPCRGMPRYKRAPCERYLSRVEYRRLGGALCEEKEHHPAQAAIISLLLFTGARVGEIRDLKWEWVRPPHIVLPDSKTGAKLIWLNSQALAVLDSVPRREGDPFVFPNRSGTAPLNIDPWWYRFRRSCALPDVRLHDLRHSFASTAIMTNVPLATIGKLLGHQLPETTTRYAHLSDEVIADAAGRISGGIAKALGVVQ